MSSLGSQGTSRCPQCGSKNVAIIPAPGGWLEMVCDDCAEVWWDKQASA